MLTVHHLEYSQSFRILWLLELLGAPYELKRYERDPDTRLAPAAYKAISPLGTSPTITDGDLVLAETNAIVDHILDGHEDSGLRPAPGTPHRDRYLFWFHAAQGSMMPLLIFDAVFSIVRSRLPFFLKPLIGAVLSQVEKNLLKPRMDALLAKAEADLAEAPWFGGDAITAADVVMAYCMFAGRARGYIGSAHPRCLDWIARVEADPAFQAAKEKDGKPSMVPDFS
jgi:glutathione S-transferase